MSLVQVSKGYQITIPAEIRKKLAFGKGSKLDMEIVDNKIVLEPLKVDWDKIFVEVKKLPKHNLTPEQLDEIYEKENMES